MQLSLMAMSASLKWNIYQSKIIEQFGFEIAKEIALVNGLPDKKLIKSKMPIKY